MSLRSLLSFCLFLSGASFAQTEYKARIGIEHEVIFTFDKALTVDQITAALAKHTQNTLSHAIPPDIRGFIKTSIDLRYDDIDTGYSEGDEVIYQGEIRTVKEVKYNATSISLPDEEILTLDNGETIRSELLRMNLFSFLHTDTGDVLEFIEPNGADSYTDRNTYISAIKTIEKNEEKYIRIIEQALKRSFVSYKRYNLENTPNFSYSHHKTFAYLYMIQKTYDLKIVPASFGSIKNYFALDSYSINWAPIQQARSYHLSITLPSIVGRTALEQALYSTYTLQWLEPLLAAHFLSGNPHIDLKKGTQGSYRLLNNAYTSAGTVPLKLCGSDIPKKGTCIDQSNISSDRFGFSSPSKLCYRSLITSSDNRSDTHH
jgi:hypothetical protein